MRLSQLLMPTLREVPADAEIPSHVLMLKAGLMRKLAAGIYVYLPLGKRVLKKVEEIVREEMDREGSQEVLMSALIPAELFKETGRWDVFGPEMFKLKDRNERDFCLGPTHEEVFTDLVRNEVKSYRQLPLILYQIQTKFRDERRPRFGVMRSREFIMKDAYSFDADWEGLDESFNKMYRAYCRIFDRCGLKYLVVEADPGAMGGRDSKEFMVISSVGEAVIAYCDSCGYAANEEKAECLIESRDEEMLEIEKVYTPNVKTIEELVDFLKISPSKFVKTLIYKAKGKVVAALVRGDRDINETKLLNVLGIREEELELADGPLVEEVTGAKVGFAGPLGLKGEVTLVVDSEIPQLRNFIVGANETDYHIKNVNYGRDFKGDIVADIKSVVEGDRCPRCGAPLKIARGIEVGHIFKLGTKYSEALGATYTDEEGNEKPIVMGCYGIGINRTVAAIIEQHHDEKGIIWPMSVAPYHVIVVPVNVSDEEQKQIAEKIYNKLLEEKLEVLIDDRDVRAGVKFNDADLIGIPVRVTIGKKVKEGIVEIKLREREEVEEVKVEEAVRRVKQIVEEKLRELS
ncbi:MAG: Proline--tRNA ligase [Caldanaerobacter subterraneus]|uniref:Proline--tRNA ligase n=2 Tax=Caldanaerobacter subterraneus TaxID=911092 RepID=A0A124FCI1_9THEO|nr:MULTISPECIES: proline--tRNA ligase [Caldanaerobacter]ERM91032.1 prolyl-tRNA synthetase [Caldanaerobacter subterraneus subsp. yonseiensis KB-1]KUK08710.1 MAG: Proline--tRNA ligase [Caldanaerobacter subterraneus]MDI3518890.1 prolyl-tRNA synthetase [Caldanaerobacter sp.]TCO59133.1 prolyl-tRNA synthetase [Caldanaerobacter subterraneus]HBT49135.1 proline--tRNA ligase [Caldanaerobacter subterraneus]